MEIENLSDEYKNDAGCYVVVCYTTGMTRMKPEEFLDYDETQQVSHGEEGRDFVIYGVYLFDAESNLLETFNWHNAQIYFKPNKEDYEG